jgi:hypothetical protein
LLSGEKAMPPQLHPIEGKDPEAFLSSSVYGTLPAPPDIARRLILMVAYMSTILRPAHVGVRVYGVGLG